MPARRTIKPAVLADLAEVMHTSPKNALKYLRLAVDTLNRLSDHGARAY
jgi:hypothetical protein